MENKPKTVQVVMEHSKTERLDKYLAAVFKEYSRTFFQNLIKNGAIKLNGISASPKTLVYIGNEIQIEWPEEKNYSIPEPEKFNYTILFEDDDLLVIDKPSGIVVHPAAGNWSGTIVNALIGKDASFVNSFLQKPSSNSDMLRPGIVHRLDKETSGCLIVAKNIRSKTKLAEFFAQRKVKKIYKAITYGIPAKENEKIETFIARHHINRQKMAVVKNKGRVAITIYNVLKKWDVNGTKLALLDVEILTGRTHQIRVHLAYKKCPILGDKLYGGKQAILAPRQMLHAYYLSFPHPISQKTIEVKSPLPKDFLSFLCI